MYTATVMTDRNQYMRALARRQRPALWVSPDGPARHKLCLPLSKSEYRDAIAAAKAEGGSVSAFLRAAVRERSKRVLEDADARPRVRRL